jgi:hypothetical protein
VAAFADADGEPEVDERAQLRRGSAPFETQVAKGLVGHRPALAQHGQCQVLRGGEVVTDYVTGCMSGCGRAGRGVIVSFPAVCSRA